MKKLTLKIIIKDSFKLTKEYQQLTIVGWIVFILIIVACLSSMQLLSKALFLLIPGLSLAFMVYRGNKRLSFIKSNIRQNIKIMKDVIVDKKRLKSRRTGRHKTFVILQSGISDMSRGYDGVDISGMMYEKFKINKECYLCDVSVDGVNRYLIYLADKYELDEEVTNIFSNCNVRYGMYDSNGIERVRHKRLNVASHYTSSDDHLSEQFIFSQRRRQTSSKAKHFFIYKDTLINKVISEDKNGTHRYMLYFEEYSDRVEEHVEVSKDCYEQATENEEFYLIRFAGEKFVYQTYPANKFSLDENLKDKLRDWHAVAFGNFYKSVELCQDAIERR